MSAMTAITATTRPTVKPALVAARAPEASTSGGPGCHRKLVMLWSFVDGRLGARWTVDPDEPAASSAVEFADHGDVAA